MVQFTLVDCPGHASLIKTVIGGKSGVKYVIQLTEQCFLKEPKS